MLKVEDLNSILQREADYTVRLLHKTKRRQNLNKVIFGVLLFDGKKDLWSVSFFTRKRVLLSIDDQEQHDKALQFLIEKVQKYIDDDYRITVVQSGYHVTPW